MTPPPHAPVIDLKPASDVPVPLTVPPPPPASPPPPPPANPPPSGTPPSDRWSAAARVVIAVGVAWILLLFCNWRFTEAKFSHLDGWRTGTVRDYLRWSQAGHGSSRPLTADDGKKRYQLLDRLLVTNQSAESFLTATVGTGRLDEGKWRELWEVIADTYRDGRPPQPPPSPTPNPNWFRRRLIRTETLDSPAGHFKMLLRAQHAREVEDDASKKKDFESLAEKLEKYDPRCKGLSPLLDEYNKSKDKVDEAVTQKLLPQMAVGNEDEIKKFVDGFQTRRDNFRPAHPDSDPPGARPSPTLSILYFPPPLAAGGESKAARQYAFALQLDQEGGFESGWAVRARYFLFDLNNLNRPAENPPITSPQRPAIDVVTRSSGWLGLRPTKSLVSEEQLAARFFTELDGLARGSGEAASLKPEPKVADEYQRAVHRILLETLGQYSGASAGEFPPVHPVGEWVVWPRRINGGTWWGVIQFAVLAAVVGFCTEWIAVGRSLTALRNTLSRPVEPGWLGRAWAWLGAELRELLMLPPRKLPAADAEAAGLLALAIDPSRDAAPRQDAATALRVSMDRSLATARLIAGLLPLVGFLGSVAGLSNSLIESAGVSSPDPVQRQSSLVAMQIALGTAFDKSILAFAGSIFCLIGLHRLNGHADEVESVARNRLLPPGRGTGTGTG